MLILVVGTVWMPGGRVSARMGMVTRSARCEAGRGVAREGSAARRPSRNGENGGSTARFAAHGADDRAITAVQRFVQSEVPFALRTRRGTTGCDRIADLACLIRGEGDWGSALVEFRHGFLLSLTYRYHQTAISSRAGSRNQALSEIFARPLHENPHARLVELRSCPLFQFANRQLDG